MAKPRMLFVDDRTKRIHYAIEELGKIYDVTIAANVPEALRAISRQEWDVVSLDFDLNGHDYNDPDGGSTGEKIVMYFIRLGWPPNLKKPRFVIHSSNAFGSARMSSLLLDAGFSAERKPIDYHAERGSVGLIAGAFDVIHPGYIFMLEDAKKHCDHLIVAVHTDPSIERPSKMRPILELHMRMNIVGSIRYVDNVVWYQSEDDLRRLIKEIGVDILIVGSDWNLKDVTGADLVKEVYYHNRDHDWSAAKFKQMIADSYFGQIVRDGIAEEK